MFKKILIVCLFLSAPFLLKAQNNNKKADDFGRIVLSSYLDESKTDIPRNSFNILKSKLSQIVTKNGMGGSIAQRFIITANVDIVTQDITPTAPPMHALNLNVTFYIGDGVDGTLFSSTSVPVKGVGETIDKAIISALKRISPSNPEIQRIVELGKNRIIEYYNANGDIYIAKAKALAKDEQFDEAIYMLMSIPEVCKDVHQRAMMEVENIFKSKIDTQSAKKLSEARAIWNAGQDYEAAERAAAILAEIHPQSSSYAGANALNSQMAKRIKELDNREWNFRVQQQQNAHQEEMAQIKAYKEIAVAQAVHQPQIEYRLLWW